MSPAFIAGIGSYLAEQATEEDPMARHRRPVGGGWPPAGTTVDVTADQRPVKCQAHDRDSIRRRSSSTAITWWPRPTRRSNSPAGRVEDPSRAQAVPLSLAEEEDNSPPSNDEHSPGSLAPQWRSRPPGPPVRPQRLQRVLQQDDAEEAETYLQPLVLRGQTLPDWTPVKEFVATVEAHWDGILAWQAEPAEQRAFGGTNSLVQAAKRRARGYRSKAKMITIIYLIAGNCPLPQIHTI